MKVKIEYTVEVDAQEWSNEFFIDKSDVREDVKNYFQSIEHCPLSIYSGNGSVKIV